MLAGARRSLQQTIRALVTDTRPSRWSRWRAHAWLRGTVVGPTLLGLAIVTVTFFGYRLNAQYADPAQSSVWQIVFATVGLFTGTYTPLSGDHPIPPLGLSIVGTCALAVTLLTAGSLLLLSRRVSDFVRIMRPRARLVVIGDGNTAAALIKSSINQGIPAILVTDSRESISALATNPSTPVIASGEIQSALATPSARRVIRHTKHVVVATDSDDLNMQLHATVHTIREGRSIGRGLIRRRHVTEWDTSQSATTDLVVIRDPGYADLLSPETIRGVLPSNEITCPSHNVAEHVAHLIVAAATGVPGISGVAVELVGSDCGVQGAEPALDLSRTIRLVVQRLSWSLSFVKGDEATGKRGPREYEPVPYIRLLADDDAAEGELLVQVFAGGSAALVASQVLSNQNRNALRIAVANTHVINGAVDFRHRGATDPDAVTTGRDWIRTGAGIATVDGNLRPPLLVVDPNEVGLDAALVTDDTGTQWARTFDMTYGLMFSNGEYAVTGWQPGAPMGETTKRVEADAINAERAKPATPGGPAWPERKRTAAFKARKTIGNRYSSKYAVEHMLKLLTDCGYELRRVHAGDEPPDPQLGSRGLVEYIAEQEHHHWLRRTWNDTSRIKVRVESVCSYSGSQANEFCYRGLVELEGRPDTPGRLRYAANYNRRIATETYPAIAASFGYAIVKFGDTDRIAAEISPCDRPECPCARPE